MGNRKIFKKFTVILVPEGSKGVKQFRVYFLFLPIMFLFMVSWVTYFSWVIFDHEIIRPSMLRLGQLEDENEKQKHQFNQLSIQLDHMKQKLVELKGYKSQKMSNWDPFNDYRHFPDAGDAYLHLVGSSFSVNERPQKGRLSEPLLLASLDDPINRSSLLEVVQKKYHKNGIKPGRAEAYVEKDEPIKGKNGRIRRKIRSVAIELGLDPKLALSMAKVESGYNPTLVSPKGAIGVLQVTPRLAWHDFKVPREKLFDPNVNIRVGLIWMKHLLKRFDYNIDLSLAAYNSGVSRVVRAGYKIPRIRETRNYVKRVKRAMKKEEV